MYDVAKTGGGGMIDLLGRVMLYVNNPKAEADFWTGKVGFTLLGEQALPGGAMAYEVAPSARSETKLALFDRETVARAEPDLNLGTPSILFGSCDLRKTYDDFVAAGILTGELSNQGDAKTFNFQDPEGNWFAVREEARGAG